MLVDAGIMLVDVRTTLVLCQYHSWVNECDIYTINECSSHPIFARFTAAKFGFSCFRAVYVVCMRCMYFFMNVCISLCMYLFLSFFVQKTSTQKISVSFSQYGLLHISN